VQSLVTAVLPNGLNLQVLGLLDGTVDEYHMPPNDRPVPQIGQKVKARILYHLDSVTPPKLGLSLAQHVVGMDVRRHGTSEASPTTLVEAFPIGTVLESVEVRRVEPERGLVVEVVPGLEAFVHVRESMLFATAVLLIPYIQISHVSDDHVPTLPPSTGPWKVGTVHRARVTGHIHFDGLLQLSLRPSILNQKFLQVCDVSAGEVVKATIKKLTDTAMFVTMSGSVDGVIWPNHYADISLKHPAKRFKVGASIKCRVLVVDPERNRIALTAKKTLVESTLPVVSSWDDAQIGVVSHAVVFKVSPKSLQVEFYNNLKAIIPIKEVR
jgi:rRNA biogenesis protein RRP5